MKKTKTLIQGAVEKNANNPAIIVTHSMGGLIFNRFLNDPTIDQIWKAKYIDRVVTVAGMYKNSMHIFY